NLHVSPFLVEIGVGGSNVPVGTEYPFAYRIVPDATEMGVLSRFYGLFRVLTVGSLGAALVTLALTAGSRITPSQQFASGELFELLGASYLAAGVAFLGFPTGSITHRIKLRLMQYILVAIVTVILGLAVAAW